MTACLSCFTHPAARSRSRMAFDPQGQAGAAGNDDLYEVLGVSPTADPDELDATYARLLAGLSGSAPTSPDAGERLRRRRIRLANAYAVLADPAQRAAYDVRLGLVPPPAAEPAAAVVEGEEAVAPPMPMPQVVPPGTTPPPMPMPAVQVPEPGPPPMPMPSVQVPE